MDCNWAAMLKRHSGDSEAKEHKAMKDLYLEILEEFIRRSDEVESVHLVTDHDQQTWALCASRGELDVLNVTPATIH